MALSESGRLRFPAWVGEGWCACVGKRLTGLGLRGREQGGPGRRQTEAPVTDTQRAEGFVPGKQGQESLSLGALKRLITYEFYHLERSIKPTSAQKHPDAYCSAPALIRAQRGSCVASPNISQVTTKTGLICLADASPETSINLL